MIEAHSLHPSIFELLKASRFETLNKRFVFSLLQSRIDLLRKRLAERKRVDQI